MKFTLSWLYEHLQSDASLPELTDALTAIGLEVEAAYDPAKTLAGFEVAEIIKTAPHPQADRLKICTVQSSTGTQDLICGAANAREGLKGILAREGAIIPASGMVLGRAKIRGVESAGMMCSGAELEISDDSDGIIELDKDSAIGTPAAQALGLDDPVIEIGITPNRPDCLGVRGIARDLAAFGLGVLKQDTMPEVAWNGDCPIAIKVETDRCGGFAGALVEGVTIGASPEWLARRLRAIGLRPINAAVDMTNYIAYDRGRPLHVYDADKLTGAIGARDGQAGERFIALDGAEIAVDKRDCVIADEAGVLGLGGVMGGEASGCTEATSRVFIESAWFAPEAIAESGRRHNIDSDARYRFERGVDPQSVEAGLQLAVAMLCDLCGGTVQGKGFAGALPDGRKNVAFAPSEVARLTGIEVAPSRMAEILSALGFAVTDTAEPWQVTAPSWRPDIDGAADIVEEVMRIYGLDKVPSTPLTRQAGVARAILTEAQIRLGAARRALAARGLTEAVTWSFVTGEQAARFGGAEGLTLANPISSELSVMRPSLLPNLLAAAARNVDRGAADVALFEVGQVFTGAMPNEQAMHASGIRRGRLYGRHWQGAGAEVDAFLARADAECVLAHLGVDVANVSVRTDAPDYYHPGQGGVLCRDPRVPLAFFGALHPALLPFFDIEGAVVAFEVFPQNLPLPKRKRGNTRPAPRLAKLQAVRRDFAFEVGADVEAQSVLRAAAGADKQHIKRVSLFDVFVGAGVGAGKKSLAIEVVLQPTEASFTDAEIDAVAEKIVQAVEKATGGTLRQ